MNGPTTTNNDSTTRLQVAAERLRARGLEAERAGHVDLANLCWRKRVEALNVLGMIAAEDARRQHLESTHRGYHPRLRDRARGIW